MMSENDADWRTRFEMAFDNLPWVQREILKLHRAEGYNYAEVAWLLGVSDRFVQRQIAKALCNIDKQMAGAKLRWWDRFP